MLEARKLHKRFGERVAVEAVSFTVAPGEVVGLLGPNGAGKTTTVSMIAGLLTPDGGEVEIEGRPLAGDADPRKRLLGLVPQELALYEELPARENLQLFGALYGLAGRELARAVARSLDFVGLSDRASDRVDTFSGGMKRRLNLAAGLLHDPQFLLLDEPTTGVDPQSRNALFDNFEELKRQGKAILYTTHYMEEAERLCDRIVIVDHGAVIADDTLAGLYRRLPAANRLLIDLAGGADGVLAGLSALPEVAAAELEGGRVSVALHDLAGAAPVLAWLSSNGHPFTHVASERGDLEAVFLLLTGRSLRDQ